MKFSEQWLREWVNPKVETSDLADQLTMAGLEVDGIEAAAADFKGVVIGHVLTVEKHPQADKLNLCRVDVGEAEPLSIVCGASNVAEGVKVPTAVIGAILPGGFKIKKAKLRGVASFGMLCSAKELGLAEDSEGLMLLSEEAPLGEDLHQWLNLDDRVIEVDFTPNRGDCLSIAGMAREVGVLYQTDVTEPSIDAAITEIEDCFPVEVQAPADCPRYLGRVIKGINPEAESPLWLQEKLRRSGLRCLGPLVDATNYLLLELGQPMHAFDLAKLNGKIIVRRAHAGESLKLLDDSEIKLSEDVLVIADEKQAQAFAGVMGGADSAVGDQTTDIFLECAFFSPDAIRGKARRFGMQTDSSYRFERGVDYQLQQQAMERATALILEIAGGRAGPIVEVAAQDQLPDRKPILLRKSRLHRILGVEVAEQQVQDYLTRLGMSLETVEGGWQVTPPSYRFDIAIEADLIEEIGRIYGYNNIPTHTPSGKLQMRPQPEALITPGRIRQLLIDRGYQETISYSFVDPAIQRVLDPERKLIELSNPISSEMSAMRTTLWSSLLKSATYNQARQQSRIRLFEQGMRFINDKSGVRQDRMIAGVAVGSQFPEHWSEKPHSADFFDIKSDVEAILGLTRRAGEFIFEQSRHPALHPGQCAQLMKGRETVGWIGTIHPNVQQALDLPPGVVVFELDYSLLSEGVVPKFSAISKFPSIRRDLALVVDEKLSAHEISSQIDSGFRGILKSIEIFDVYRGKGIPEGKKSLAFALTIQDDNQTLTDAEVEALTQDILAVLEQTTGATLRE